MTLRISVSSCAKAQSEAGIDGGWNGRVACSLRLWLGQYTPSSIELLVCFVNFVLLPHGPADDSTHDLDLLQTHRCCAVTAPFSSVSTCKCSWQPATDGG